MAGTASVGQQLTPNPNVFAHAGTGGDTWGANGGGQVAAGGGVTDQTGYVKPIASTLCDGETATNYIAPAQIPRTGSMLSRESNGSSSGQSLDNTIGGGGTNAG